MARNLVNLESVSKAFDIKELLQNVSIGVSQGDRIGIVGRNGAGKSTLMKIIAGTEDPDSGRVTKSGGTNVGILSQIDNAPKGATVRDVVLGDKATHEWARDAGIRAIFTGLFGGYHEELFTRGFASLSGGERRRVGLAKLLIEDLDLILLDEPTNHLDVEGVAWLAEHLKNRKNLAVVVVTHDRWFLDEVTEKTWEVVGGALEEYDGGYSAYVLAKAERARQQSAMDARRNNLLRKELAWLRRGAPARTSKPKFRVDAANELISAEPPPRDNTELLKFSQNRLGNTVFECQHLQIRAGENVLIEDLVWNIGPGERIGIVGVNGAGKTTLMRTLAGEHFAAAGKLVKGVTVKVAMLSQHLAELDPTWRLIEAVERVATRVELGGGRELSASQLCEKLGFDRESQWTPVGDLSGGEKRRLQLTRLLMDSPNVLLLDEPTNDFDIEILTELEDLLDSFAGTLLVISHDRYFLERTCDQIVGLLGDGKVTDLPRGIDQYLEKRAVQIEASLPKTNNEKKISTAAEERQNKKDLIRIERQMEKLDEEIKELERAQEAAAFDAEALLKATAALKAAQVKREALEEEWLSKCV
ncbi:MAG: ABC-F family ATP-binding cassette domain-containing protein [Candidatus Nanopelagicaceae bacterium]|nr:ABC-F family ATP-binding cassette domain-containing protein [Candidatus Nanopelagicaceae bacterium]